MLGDFEGLVAVVTGGASGIGAAVVRELGGARGARVAVLDLNPGAAENADLAIETDVSDDASVRAAIHQVVSELG